MERDQSEFNVALSALDVLNRLFTQCSIQAMMMDAAGWFNSLLAIKRRIKVYMKKDEVERTSTFIETIHSKMTKFNKDLQRTGSSQIEWDLYMDLDQFEEFLNKICHDSALIVKYKEKAEEALR
ncbi:unnamed protein product [marine sediment metagenome]|uniref:Uncharacterized protein n=1 Tax=marine sediment metagenome TaxID=412755 RepID=X0XXZ9_9ZZZZ